MLRPLKDYAALLLEETDDVARKACTALLQPILLYEHATRRRWAATSSEETGSAMATTANPHASTISDQQKGLNCDMKRQLSTVLKSHDSPFCCADMHLGSQQTLLMLVGSREQDHRQRPVLSSSLPNCQSLYWLTTCQNLLVSSSHCSSHYKQYICMYTCIFMFALQLWSTF